MNARNARELNALARNLGMTKRQLRAMKRQLNATPKNQRGKALDELRTGNAKYAAHLAAESTATACHGCGDGSFIMTGPCTVCGRGAKDA